MHVQESRYMCCHPWKEVTRSGSCVERCACVRQTVCAHACGKWAVKSRHCIPSAWAWLRACSCVHARRCLLQACRPDSALPRRCMGTWSVQYSRWYALLCWDLRTRQTCWHLYEAAGIMFFARAFCDASASRPLRIAPIFGADPTLEASHLPHR